MIIYSSFASGLETVVHDIIKNYAKIVKALNGAVIYDTTQLRDILTIPCFNNHFQVLFMKSGTMSPNNCVAELLRNKNRIRFTVNDRTNTFRLMVSDQNSFVSADKQLKSELEHLIAQKTGLMLDRAFADEEFWVLKRSENLYMFMRRLNNHARQSYDKILRKGELRPEIAYIMNYLSNPTPNDIYLDPFAGSGALGLSRYQHFGKCKRIYMFDNDESKVNQIRRTIGEQSSVYVSKTIDIRHIHTVIPANGVTNIVTDPPWGLFDKKDNMEEFYIQMLAQFKKALAPNANVVVLTSRDADFTNALRSFSVNACLQRHILVSGKKATITAFQM
ncbi:MAG: RsmD family RNA methyltransferase [Oscillospiraceae bacterium]|nr:RsmD family RNA methyltransferase [Oscillospiraceae bacterium]